MPEPLYNPGVMPPEDNSPFSCNPLKWMWDLTYLEAQARSLGQPFGRGLMRRSTIIPEPRIVLRNAKGRIIASRRGIKVRTHNFHSPGIFGLKGLFTPAGERSLRHGVWKLLDSRLVQGTSFGAKVSNVGLLRALPGMEQSRAAMTVSDILAGRGAVSLGGGMLGKAALWGARGFSLYTYLALGRWIGKQAFQGIYGLSDLAGQAAGRIRGDLGTRFSTQLEDHFYTAQSATERMRALQVIQESHGGGFRPTYGNEAALMHRAFGR